MNDYLFHTGKGQSGLVAFQQNLLKVCIEDAEFYDENWENIDPNDYADYHVRALLPKMRRLKSKGITPTYDALFINIENSAEGFEKTVFMDTLKALRDEVTLTTDEIDKIKREFMYFGLWASMVSQANNILDWAKTGVSFGSQVVNKYEQTIVARDRSEKNTALGIIIYCPFFNFISMPFYILLRPCRGGGTFLYPIIYYYILLFF